MKDKRDHILETAWTLFAQEGLSVPTAKIAKEAGVANGTLFNYFPNKQLLIDTIYLQVKREIIDMFSMSGSHKADNLKDMFFLVWQSYIHWALKKPLKHKAMCLLKTSNGISPEAIAEAEASFLPWHSLVEEAIRKKIIAKIDLDYLYQLKGAQIDALITYAMMKNLKGKALDAHVKNGFEIYWKGITP